MTRAQTKSIILDFFLSGNPLFFLFLAIMTRSHTKSIILDLCLQETLSSFVFKKLSSYQNRFFFNMKSFVVLAMFVTCRGMEETFP